MAKRSRQPSRGCPSAGRQNLRERSRHRRLRGKIVVKIDRPKKAPLALVSEGLAWKWAA